MLGAQVRTDLPAHGLPDRKGSVTGDLAKVTHSVAAPPIWVTCQHRLTFPDASHPEAITAPCPGRGLGTRGQAGLWSWGLLAAIGLGMLGGSLVQASLLPTPPIHNLMSPGATGASTRPPRIPD